MKKYVAMNLNKAAAYIAIVGTGLMAGAGVGYSQIPDPTQDPNYFIAPSPLGHVVVFTSPTQEMPIETMENLTAIYKMSGITVSMYSKELSAAEQARLKNALIEEAVEDADTEVDAETRQREQKVINFYSYPDEGNVLAEALEINKCPQTGGYPCAVYMPFPEYSGNIQHFNPEDSSEIERLRDVLKAFKENPDMYGDEHKCSIFPEDPRCMNMEVPEDFTDSWEKELHRLEKDEAH